MGARLRKVWKPKHIPIVFGFALTVFIWGCPTVRPPNGFRPEQLNIQGPFHHEASGITFPESVGNYQRNIIGHYDGNFQDVSAGYNLKRDADVIFATVYVYSIPGVVSILSPPHTTKLVRSMAVTNEFSRNKHEIQRSHPAAKLTEEGETTLMFGNRTHIGWRATFELDGARFGQRNYVTSHLYVFPYVSGNWALKYRFTHSKAAVGLNDIETFMRDLKMTFKESSTLQLPGVFETTR
ncbi:MAG: hypothetical protein ABIP88_10120 [Candidatus Binatia bacterium]